jgi:hypothetical protein
MLLKAGIPEAQIKTRVVDGSRDAASDILQEVRGGDYGTNFLGRRGRSGMKEFFKDSITTIVLQHSSGMAVWVLH